MTNDLFGNPGPSLSPLSPSERRWLPDEMLDEVCPPPRAKPEDWLIKGVERDWWITDEDDEDSITIRIVPGDTVGFCWTRSWGAVPFTIRRDGSFSTPVTLPAEANCFAEDGDIETMMDTTEAFAREYAAATFFRDEKDDEIEVMVQVYQWSETVTFRLAVDPSGAASLEEVVNDG